MVENEIKALEFLAGGGEMGERIRHFDWRATPLGMPEQWPQSLKTCVRIMLSSKQPIWIGWGSELIKLYNDAYIDIVRGKHPIALGQPASVVWKDIWKDIEPLLTRALKKDEGTYVESQLLIMERSGFPEETYYTFSYTPVLGADGFPEGMICYNTADTERIINERSLKTMQQLDTLAQKKSQQEVYAQAVKALALNNKDFPFAVLYTIKIDGRIAELAGSAGFQADDARLEQTLDLEATGTNASRIRRAVHENHIVEFTDETGDNLPKGAWDVSTKHIVNVPIKSANKQFPLAVLTLGLNPYRKFDDAYKNFVQLIADQISLGVNNTIAYEEERKRAKALEELDKAKTLFFTNISHEFRTPLMLILGPLEELLNQSSMILGDAEKQRVEVTYRNALRLLKLVNALLDFSRIESGRHQANFVLTDVAPYTKNLAANFRSVIEKADLHFHVVTEEAVPPVYLDRQMWEKIVFNLLSNAFKYTLKGTITLSVKANDGYVCLAVEDTGVGIPDTELPRIFERFHRVENTAGRTFEGTGIGLALVKELVHLHQGTIEVQSVEGEGSKFSISLPVGKTHLSGAQIFDKDPGFEISGSSVYLHEAATLIAENKKLLSQKPEDKASDQAEEQALVMIVDDNADMRQHIQSLIATKYRTVTATNGLDALKKIKEQRPTLILSDIMMPEIDGIELLRRLKSNRETAQIPIVLVTARAGEESKIEGYEIGADDYLVKPFSANEMLARIKAQIKIYNTRKHVERRLKGFLMQMPAVVSLVEGPDFRFVMANAMFQKTFDRSWSQLRGVTLAEAFPEFESQEIGNLYEQVYMSGEPLVRQELPVSWHYQGQRKSAYFDLVIYPVNNGNNQVNELMIHAVDITMQVEARKKIEESEKQFRDVLLESPNIFAILQGPEMRIDFFNEPLLTSWGRTKDILGKNLMDVLPELTGQAFPKLLEQVYNTGVAYYGSEEKASIIKNGVVEDIYCNYVYQPIYNADKAVSGITIMATDITEQVSVRKKLEKFTDELEQTVEQRTQDLLKANKELESFNYIASHDLQEPLRKIQTFIHMISKSNHDEKAAQVYYQKINASAQRMSDLIQSVLAYSRLAKTGEETALVDLNKILKDIEIDFELVIAEKEATVTYESLPTVQGNGFQLNQLFSNLISNSLKFSNEKPEINITSMLVTGEDVVSATPLNPKDWFYKITFSDNGIGFEQEYSEKIFSLFQRLHGKSEYSGTGIGLSIVKKIIEQHNGYITAESSPGHGAVFNIWLPAKL